MRKTHPNTSSSGDRSIDLKKGRKEMRGEEVEREVFVCVRHLKKRKMYGKEPKTKMQSKQIIEHTISSRSVLFFSFSDFLEAARKQLSGKWSGVVVVVVVVIWTVMSVQ